MAFQDSCGTIILDAVLTDIGRQKMARNKFEIEKFALGDDEVDYSINNGGSGDNFQLLDESATPILESFGSPLANIQHGLMDLNYRTDVWYIPQFFINQRLGSACRLYDTRYYLSVNDETTTKLKSDLGQEFILENNMLSHNFIFIESGIVVDSPTLDQSPAGKERFITNLGLYDEYIFVYCDKRVVDKLLVNPSDSFFKNDSNNNLYLNVVPLRDSIKISLPPPIENYETFKVKTIDNQVFDDNNPSALSAVEGPRGIAFAMNIKINDRLVNDSSSTRDQRYNLFGLTDQSLFGGSNNYDYIDTNIMIEGATTGVQKIISLRIIRYSGT